MAVSIVFDSVSIRDDWQRSSVGAGKQTVYQFREDVSVFATIVVDCSSVPKVLSLFTEIIADRNMV